LNRGQLLCVFNKPAKLQTRFSRNIVFKFDVMDILKKTMDQIISIFFERTNLSRDTESIIRILKINIQYYFDLQEMRKFKQN